MKTIMTSLLVSLLWLASVRAQPALPQQEWGTILGRIVYDGKGKIPAPRMIPTNKAPAPGMPAAVADESLIVSKQNSGLANVFVYLRTKPSKIHPGYEQGAAQVQTLRHKDFRYMPHALAIWKKDSLEIRNEENTGVNVVYNSVAQGFNVLISPPGIGVANNVEKKQFNVGEHRPGNLWDGIHPWMIGQLFVRDNPYFCVTDERGIFCIPNMPANEELEFQFWHERAGYLRNIKSDVAEFTFNDNGRLQMKLTQPVTDLGEFRIDPKLLELPR
jgi:hypothetical protein